MAVHEGKGGVRAVWTGRKEPFGHTGRLEPQPRGAVTRRAVAQRRSRASGLTRPLAEAIRGFDSGFGLGFVVVPVPPFRRGLDVFLERDRDRELFDLSPNKEISDGKPS